MLSDIEIKEHIEKGDISIDPPSGKIEPASYDLRVGKEGVVKDGRINIEKDKRIKIPRGTTAIIRPLEKIMLGQKIVAHFGLRSKYARKGLILLSGPQIDPGWEGYLHVYVYNVGTHPIELDYEDPFVTVEFSALNKPASKKYDGPFIGQEKITDDEAEFIERKYKSFKEIEDSLSDVKTGQDIVMNFIYFVVFGGVVAIAAIVLQLLLIRMQASQNNISAAWYYVILAVVIGIVFCIGRLIRRN